MNRRLSLLLASTFAAVAVIAGTAAFAEDDPAAKKPVEVREEKTDREAKGERKRLRDDADAPGRPERERQRDGQGPGASARREGLRTHAAQKDFWRNEKLREKLALTQEQVDALEKNDIEIRDKSIDLQAAIAHKQNALRDALKAEKPEQSRINDAIEELAKARAELQKIEISRMVLGKNTLNDEQKKQLKELGIERREQHREQRREGPGGPGAMGQQRGPGGPGGPGGHGQGFGPQAMGRGGDGVGPQAAIGRGGQGQGRGAQGFGGGRQFLQQRQRGPQGGGIDGGGAPALRERIMQRRGAQGGPIGLRSEVESPEAGWNDFAMNEAGPAYDFGGPEGAPRFDPMFQDPRGGDFHRQYEGFGAPEAPGHGYAEEFEAAPPAFDGPDHPAPMDSGSVIEFETENS